ncbi:hypothetical protein Tco_1003901 [Tanacetum coccineum]|uniref:Uncharacterized protein n=1 Tax=Tanacetum coccineum TaxID=301880 RepID=A0ABQ5FBQ4_9ASTR
MPRNAYFNPIQPNTEFNYDSEDMEFDDEARYTTDKESILSEHEAIDLAHTVNTQSFKEELSSEEDLDEWLNAEMEKHMSKQKEKNKEDALIAIIKSIREKCRVVHKNKQTRVVEADLKKSFEAMEDTVNYDSFTSNLPSLEELNPGSFLLPFTINNYNSYAMANIDASNNVMPRSIYKYLKLANLREATMLVEMDDMTQQETPGIMKNVLDTRNYDTNDPQNEIAGQTNPLLDKGGLTKRWHVCKPVQVFYDDGSGKDCGMWSTCDPDSSFCYGYK